MRLVKQHGLYVCLGILAAAAVVIAQSATSAKPAQSQSIAPGMRRVSPGTMYYHVWVVSELVGTGKPGDARRPIFVPPPPAPNAKPGALSATMPAVATAETGLLGFQMQLSDDGKYALAELVYASSLAFQNALKNEVTARNISVPGVPVGGASVSGASAVTSASSVSSSLASALETAVPGLQIFERGQATEAQILAAFQQKKKSFSFSSTSSVRP